MNKYSVVCAICSNPFMGRTSTAKYCSDACRKVASNNRVKAWHHENKAKVAAWNRRWREANRDKHKEYGYLDSFGLTFDEYHAFIRDHGGACEICGTTDTLVIDHNHKTGAIRGVLCRKHNKGLGLFDDSTVKMKRVLRLMSRA